MAIDLTGGLNPDRDLYLSKRPEDPEMRESVSVWISDDQGRFGFPRICLEAMSKGWDTHGIEINLAFPDGRIFTGHGPAPSISPIAADGKPRLYGAGPLLFETIKPFEHLRLTYDGQMHANTVAEQARQKPLGPTKRVQIEVDFNPCVPPFIPGTMSEEARKRMASGGEAAAMGGARYEQLFRCKGVLKIEGEPDMSFTGTGLRIHRVGVRDTVAMPGHCWQSAVFPSGKAFGYIHFPPHPDGRPGYNEAYVFDGEKMIPAVVTKAPWIHEFIPNGDDCSFALKTEDGQVVEVKGVTMDSVCTPKGVSMFGDWLHNGLALRFYHQGGARYTWDGETTYGMIERSLPQEKVKMVLGDEEKTDA